MQKIIKKYHYIAIIAVIFAIIFIFLNIDINKINMYLPLITFLLIVVLFGMFYVLFQTVDAMRSEQINIKEILKNPQTIDKIKSSIDRKVQDIYQLKKIKNDEIFHLLTHGIKVGKEYFKTILYKNFHVNFADEKRLIYEEFKSLKRNIDICKLVSQADFGKSNSAVYEYKEGRIIIFLEKLEKEVILIELDNFIINLKSISHLVNGERRLAYEKICVQMIENIVINTINLYNNFQ